MFPPLSRGALACAALIAAATASPARATPAAPDCEMTYDQVAAIGREIVSKDAEATYVEYSGDEAQKLMTAINAVEPVSHWTADKVVAIDPDGEQPFRVALIEAGCATRAFPVPREVWPALLSAALGDKS